MTAGALPVLVRDLRPGRCVRHYADAPAGTVAEVRPIVWEVTMVVDGMDVSWPARGDEVVLVEADVEGGAS